MQHYVARQISKRSPVCAQIRNCWTKPYKEEPKNPIYISTPGQQRPRRSKRRVKVVFTQDFYIGNKWRRKPYKYGYAGEVRTVSNKMYRNELMEWDIALPASRFNLNKYHNIYTRDYLQWVWSQRTNERIDRQIGNWALEINRRIDENTDKFVYPVTLKHVQKRLFEKYGHQLELSQLRFEGGVQRINEEYDIGVFVKTSEESEEAKFSLRCVSDLSPEKKKYEAPELYNKILNKRMTGNMNEKCPNKINYEKYNPDEMLLETLQPGAKKGGQEGKRDWNKYYMGG